MMRIPALARLALLFSPLIAGAGCGLEACGSLGDFNATPLPEAEIKGTLKDVPEPLRARAGGKTLKAQAISVDGAVIAEVDTALDQPFSLKLGPGLDWFNVRVVVEGGSLAVKDFVPEAPAGLVIELPDLGVVSTASAQVVERYSVRERVSLSSTPPGTLAQVRDNARGDEAAVAAFRELVTDILTISDPNAATPAFHATSSAADDDALALAGIDPASYSAALEAAVDASLVPIVCDPSQILVMFAVDTSGQGKDGNGAPQFLRQPNKESKVFLGITLDPLSPVPDSAAALRPRLTPNDPQTEMFDDGSHGDEEAADGIFTTTLPLPRGMRVLYKYTNGSPNEGFTGTEEWPGNARILQADDVLTSSASGAPDCLVIRRDSFGDESSNKNFVNLHARLGGGALGYGDDLGGDVVPAAPDDLVGAIRPGGLLVLDVRDSAPLTPAGIPEARENGACVRCPAPLTVSADDDEAPRLVAASFVATDQTRVIFSEDIDVQSAGRAENYLLVDEQNLAIRVNAVQVTGSQVLLTHDPVDPRDPHRVNVKEVKDASLQQNEIGAGASVRVGPDLTPPTVVSVRGGSIVEVNPDARPADPATGEVVVVTFSERLDRIAAENAANYEIQGLEVFAAYQRGREVYVVTSQHERGGSYALHTGQVFDVAGNVLPVAARAEFRALSLALVTLQAVVDFAWLSLDGSEKGLPPGKGLYLTGTALRDARATDGGDLRVFGRTDVAGMAGFRFEPSLDPAAVVDDKPIYTLTVRLPAGTYSYKLAYGDEDDAISPPVTLETVTKNLATRNDTGGVAVDPTTLLGKDGQSYVGARLSTNGQDLPGPGVLFKRENPDAVLLVGETDRTLPAEVIGTWRDVPFGRGSDYDDGLVELPVFLAGEPDTDPPKLLGARARDSESVLVSFDEALVASGAVNAIVTTDETGLPVVETLVGQPLPNQLVIRTGAMANDTAYALLIGGIGDAAGNALPAPLTTGFTSPAAFQPFTPIVDDVEPTVVGVRPSSPTEIEVTFSERLADASVGVADFGLSHADGGAAPSITGARLSSGGIKVLLTTTAQERQAPYVLEVAAVEDVAGNELAATQLPFVGFGEFDPPEIADVFVLSPTKVAILWNEPVTAASAGRITNYVMGEATITAVRPGSADELRNAAFNATYAPLRADVVILTTTAMVGGGDYQIDVEGVADLSGNESNTSASFTAVSAPPTVDVVLSYLISDTAGVVGVGPGGSAGSPARAISPSELAQQREGVFVLGTALNDAGSQPLADHPFTEVLTGFPEDGAPLTGAEPELLDNGMSGDAVANDRVFSVLIPDVPVGSTLSWKAFSSLTTSFAASNPEFPGAAFADATRGPGGFSDGQEFPGNDNAVFVVADRDGDGVVRIECLFGDEITFKRKTGFPAFFMAIDTARRIE